MDVLHQRVHHDDEGVPDEACGLHGDAHRGHGLADPAGRRHGGDEAHERHHREARIALRGDDQRQEPEVGDDDQQHAEELEERGDGDEPVLWL